MLTFSDKWKSYYDWDCAGKETMDEYVKDIRRHKEQVYLFLNSVDIKHLLNLKGKSLGANEMLVELGYTFT